MFNFFEFDSRGSSLKFHAHLIGYNGIHTGLIPETKLLIGDYIDFSFPIIFKHDKQHKSLDILDTGTATLYLISDKMVNILKSNKFTGWKTFPVTLLNRENSQISGYHGLSILGKCGLISYKKSKIIYKQVLPSRPAWKFYKGYQFDLSEWDGSDLFIPKNIFKIIVTDKVAMALKNDKLSNLRLTNLIEFETSEEIVLERERKQKNL
jgi:hypothetical protein